MSAAIRRERLAEALAANGIDCLLVYGNPWQSDYLRYATGFGIAEGDALAIARPQHPVALVHNHPQEAERAAAECPELEVTTSPDLIGGVLAALAGQERAVATAPGNIFPCGIARRAHAFCPKDATPILDRLLMQKTSEELVAVREAARLSDEGYEVFRTAAQPGRADYEIVAEVEAFFRTRDVEDNFMLIGCGGPEVRGMAPPSGKILKEGDLVTTEVTPSVDGYYVQICRTMVVGQASDAQRQAFGIFHDALEAGLAAVKPGATAAEIARAENDVFRTHGLGDYVTSQYTRVRGHGLGLFPDTKPQLLESNNTAVTEGMALIVHPNTYHPSVGYVVLGDALIVGEPSNEILTRTPRQLFESAERVASC